MNTSKLFDFFSHTDPFNPKSQALLDKIMSIENPMDCSDDVATEDQLRELEEELDRIELKRPEVKEFCGKVKNLKSSESHKNTFI